MPGSGIKVGDDGSRGGDARPRMIVISCHLRHLRRGTVTGRAAARAQIGVKPRSRPRHGFVTAP